MTVDAAAPLVDSTSASLGTVVDQQPILDLPLNLRRTGALALVVPGTVDTTGQIARLRKRQRIRVQRQ